MPDNPTALNPPDQPMVNALTNECRLISPTITARNWQSQGIGLSQRITQLFVLTGDTNLSGYMDMTTRQT